MILEGQARATDGAEGVCEALRARRLERSQMFLTLRVAESVERHEKIRGERCASGFATARAVAIVRPLGRLCQLVTNRPTEASTGNGHATHLAAQRTGAHLPAARQCTNAPPTPA